MDLTVKKSSRRAAKNSKGKRNNIIQRPGDMDSIFSDDSPNRNSNGSGRRGRDRSRGRSQHGDESDNSNFSTGCHVDGSPGKGRSQKGRKGDRNQERKKQQKEQRKRQYQKDKLAEAQRQKDSQLECIDMTDEDEGTAGATFDGVRTDKVNANGQEMIDRVMQQCGNNDDDVKEIADTVKCRQRGKQNKFRGNNHEKSAFARSLSPKGDNHRMQKDDRNQGSRRNQMPSKGNPRQGRSGLTAYSHSSDPLDEACDQQDNNRSGRASSSTASAVRGEAIRGTAVEYVTRPPESKQRDKGKNLSMTQKVGSSMALLDKWKGDQKKKKVYGTVPILSKREKQAGAALVRSTATEDMGRSRDRGNLSSGEKRKSSERLGDGHASKKRISQEGSHHNAIDVDSDDPPATGIGGNDDSGAEIIAAIEGCGKMVGPEDYDHLNTSKSDAGSSSKWGLFANLGLKKNPEGSGSKGRKTAAAKKPVDNMNQHLRSTRRGGPSVDDILAPSPTSKGSLRDRGRNSTGNSNIGGQGIPKIRRSSGNGSRTNPTKSKLASQGALFEEKEKKSNDKGQWLGRMAAPKKSTTKPRRIKKKSSSPSITQFTTQRRTRSKSKNNDNKNDVITIDSSSEEEDDASNMSVDASETIAEANERHIMRAVGDVASIDAVRIAIGKKIVRTKCVLSAQFGTTNPYIQFSFEDKGKKCEHRVHLSRDELTEVKYHIAGEDGDDIDDSITAIAFRITPTEQNNFNKFTSSYNQEGSDDPKNMGKRFISVEVRDTDEFKVMLEQMRVNERLGIWCTEESEIGRHDLENYAKALLDDSRKDTNERLGIASRTRSGGTKKEKKYSENKLLLVYPFDVDESALGEAASGLKELGGDSLGVESIDDNERPSDVEMQDQSDGGNVSDDKVKSTRTHYVTIREEDVERLSPGQFLNDSLVDFWMRWISRGESNQPDSNVHFFTSHFMSTIKDDGPEAVASWTAKKNINIFDKKLIFIPVNADLHWSLCVVVNPGLIANNYDQELDEKEEHSFILFLDSLKMHNKNTYGRHIYKWLNCEWKRLGKGKVGGTDAPFSSKVMPLRSPRIPYQDNGCDCGVFVCRYAYSLLMMRHLKFTWADLCDKTPFKTLITEGPAFQFDMSDLARIRKEIGALIDKLSLLYLRAKEKEKANKKAKKRQETNRSNEDKPKESSESVVSEDAPPASEKAGTTSETIEDDGGIPEESLTETTDSAVERDGGGDAAMGSSSEEKENISQGAGSQNGVIEVTAPEKVANLPGNNEANITSDLV